MTMTSLPSSSFPDRGRLARTIEFLQAAEALEDTLRSGRTAQGRPESTAEHTWRLCLMLMMGEQNANGRFEGFMRGAA
ncbi:HD domain-containing protein [Roseibium algae]|uniref:HD domain-containing protein n=1 Tax=Roseibium algae TaxID=3123038 RepID=A0ABU8TQY5_9HYPH